LALTLRGISAAERVECRTTADNWVDAPPWEPHSRESVNYGSDARLALYGRNSFALLAFDMAAAAGMRIEKAVLRVHRLPDPVPLTVVGISTISGSEPWSEAEMNYFQARRGQPWSYAGSDLADVVFGPGGSLYTYTRAREVDGWYEIDVAPQIATALATGDQFGIMLTDEKGETRTRHTVSSRESSYPPVLILEGSRTSAPPPRVQALAPKSAAELGHTSLRPGAVILHFGATGAARYDLRYSESAIAANRFDSATPVPRWMLDPLAAKPNTLATSNSLGGEVNAVVEGLEPGKVYYFAARAVGVTGEPGPVSSLGWARAFARTWPSLPKSSAAGNPEPAQTGGAVNVWSFSELHKVNPQTGALLENGPIWKGDVKLTGARNEFVAFQVAIESQTLVKDIAVTVDQPLFAECKLPAVFQTSGAVQLYREWMVPDDKDTSPSRPWYPDPLLPLTGTFDLPAADNGVPNQRVQPVFVDIYVPHDAKPGIHHGSIAVRAGGRLLRRIGVDVQVLPMTLPDNLNFIVDLNAYGGVNPGYDIARGTPEYRQLLQEYHRVAHLNRGNLDILGYSHSGSTEPDQTPPLSGEGANTKVANWTDWDAHYGPLVSGSAFADLPRASAPVPIIYLALFENWPGDLRKTYKWNIPDHPQTTTEYQQLIARQGLAAGPIEEGFPQDYQDRFSAVAREFAGHIRRKNWKQTKYQIFFNDKYYYKDPARSPGARGVSWWLLDEPNHHDDYRALSFFGWLGKRWLKDYADVPMVFRADISYVEFIRDQLAGQLDIDCTSQHFFTKNRYLMDDRKRFGRTYWNYASTNHPRDTNVAMRAWCWRAWVTGADGIVPWNTIRGMEAWDRAEPLTVFYVGKKFGVNRPFDCLRLKAFRRGEQDVEYMTMLARKKGWGRDAVAHALTGALDLSVETRRQYDEDAGSIRFDGVADGQLDQLRLRMAAALAK
jgi:hypothetical protein